MGQVPILLFAVHIVFSILHLVLVSERQSRIGKCQKDFECCSLGGGPCVQHTCVDKKYKKSEQVVQEYGYLSILIQGTPSSQR